MNLQELLSYYSTLENIEKNSDDNKRSQRKKQNKFEEKKKNRNNDDTGKKYSCDPPCPIHNGDHHISQCKVIKKEKAKYEEKKKDRNNDDDEPKKYTCDRFKNHNGREKSRISRVDKIMKSLLEITIPFLAKMIALK